MAVFLHGQESLTAACSWYRVCSVISSSFSLYFKRPYACSSELPFRST